MTLCILRGYFGLKVGGIFVAVVSFVGYGSSVCPGRHGPSSPGHGAAARFTLCLLHGFCFIRTVRLPTTHHHPRLTSPLPSHTSLNLTFNARSSLSQCGPVEDDNCLACFGGVCGSTGGRTCYQSPGRVLGRAVNRSDVGKA